MLSERLVVIPMWGGQQYRVEREIWFFDRRGNKDWRLELVATFDTQAEADEYVSLHGDAG